MIIGICGGSGAGKTTLLKKLEEKYKGVNPSVFSLDNYYLQIDQQQKDENGEYNFDLPTALDKELLIKDLIQLKSGKSIRVKEYYFNSPPNSNTFIDIHPSELIIVEGLFLFEFTEIAKELDFSIFVHLDLDTQLERRILRDQKTRGYSKEDIVYQWENHVLPCYQKYLLPYKFDADFLFRNDEHSESDFNKLTDILDHKLFAEA